VTFNKPIEVASFTTDDIASFTGPEGPIKVTGVTVVPDSDDRQFEITFPTQSAEGEYIMVIGPDITDREGHRMDQNRNGINGEPVDQYTARFMINHCLGPDGFGYTACVHPFEDIDLDPAAKDVFPILASGDDTSVRVSLGTNTFNFYGTVYDSLFVSSNGLISVGSANSSAANDILLSAPLQPAIAPLWGDWIKTSGSPMILGKFEDTDHDGTPDRLIIQWNRVEGAPSPPGL
jgi:hypothetical protein